MTIYVRGSVFLILFATTFVFSVGVPAQEDDARQPGSPQRGANSAFLWSQAVTGGNVIQEFKEREWLRVSKEVAVDGLPQSWEWPDGSVAIRYYKCGGEVGVELFDDDMIPAARGLVCEDMPTGRWQWWYKGMRIDCGYSKGKITGAFTKCDGERVVQLRQYKDGELEGVACEFGEDGSLVGIAHWREGELSGTQVLFANERPCTVSTYKENVLNGRHIEYDEEGEVSVAGSYAEGKRAGEWKDRKSK